MRVIRIVCMAIVAIVGVAVAAAAAMPRRWSVTRSIIVSAPAQKVHTVVNSLQRWPEWTAWDKTYDAHARRTFLGGQEGEGSTMSWLGPKLGHGKATIIESSLAGGVVLDLALEGDAVNGRATISYEAVGTQTRVTWRDEGQLPFLGGVYRDTVERELTQQMESSLERLKTLVERP